MPTVRQKLSTYAITILTFQRHRHFQRTSNAELFIETLFQHRDKGRFQLHGFVVMPDHVHLLITPAIDQSTSKCIQYIKGGYSFAARQHTAGAIWHSGYHEHRIRDAEDFNNQLQYIANNPSRKQYTEYPHVHDPIPSNLREPLLFPHSFLTVVQWCPPQNSGGQLWTRLSSAFVRETV